jgi:hypothetical protein
MYKEQKNYLLLFWSSIKIMISKRLVVRFGNGVVGLTGFNGCIQNIKITTF